MLAGLAFAVMLAQAMPAAGFPIGTWFGQGQPHDRSEMWIAQMRADGEFRVHFRTCQKGKPIDQFETGRWTLKGDLEAIDIVTVNGAPQARHDEYRILKRDGQSQSYRYLRTGFVFTSTRVADSYAMPPCDLVS